MNTRTSLVTSLAALVMFTGVVAPAAAQNAPSRFQVSIYPGSRMLATSGKTDDQPKFKTYSPTASLTVAFGDHFALEGEAVVGRGVVQNMGTLGRKRSPNMFGGTINAVARFLPDSKIQPYLTVGVGGYRMLKRAELGMEHGENIESANVGGGLKVLFNGWGLRADYRYVGMDAVNEDRAAFFGPKSRRAHRLAFGFIIGSGR